MRVAGSRSFFTKLRACNGNTRHVRQMKARGKQAVGKLKRFKRVALRCEKTKRNFASFVALAAGFILIQCVYTA